MEQTKKRYLHGGMTVPFLLVTACFAAWGVAANMTDPLVQVFSRTFSMGALQASLVQSAYYGSYALLALPAAYIARRFSFKISILLGLGAAIAGALAFYPASLTMTFGWFLLALFMLAGGLAILETSANPFIMAMGPEQTATRRLNFAQAFNPVGTNVGVFLAATLILPNVNPATAEQRAAMSEAQLFDVQSAELQAVMTPYVGYALVLLALWLAIVFVPMKTRRETQEGRTTGEKVAVLPAIRRLLRNRHYLFGVGAQFFNVAAQTCTWTFTVPYVIAAIDINEGMAGWYLQASLIVFLISRFVMVYVMGYFNPTALLLGLAVSAGLLCLLGVASANMVGVIAVIAISACLSLMFPTIYGIALHGLGDDAKFGSAGLVMAILGGAIVPLIQGGLVDSVSVSFSYVVPAVCFVFVAAYAGFDLMVDRKPIRRRPVKG